jgi:hypothetical protein
MAAVELTEEVHPVHVRFEASTAYIDETSATWPKAELRPTRGAVTDGYHSFNASGAQAAPHGAIVVGKRKSIEVEL